MTDNIVFPAASGDWLAFVTTRVSERLEKVDALAVRLKDGTARTTLEALTIWNDLQIALRQARSESDVLCEVHPDADVRAAAEKGVAAAQAA
ncbi:MAG: peptidase M3, partial [Microbacterium sp.]